MNLLALIGGSLLLSVVSAGGYNQKFSYALGSDCDADGEISNCYEEAHKASYKCVKQMTTNPNYKRCKAEQAAKHVGSDTFKLWWPLSMEWHESVISCVCPDCIKEGARPKREANENYRECFTSVRNQNLMDRCNKLALKCEKFKVCYEKNEGARAKIDELKQQSKLGQQDFDACMAL